MNAALHPLPMPGPAFGPYPERPELPGSMAPGAAGGRAGVGAAGPGRAGPWRPGRAGAAAAQAFADRVHAQRTALPAVGSARWHDTLRALAADLGLHGLAGAVLERAFACVLAAADATLGVALYDTQLHAARLLLDRRLAEMATGEGKTHAAMVAAAAAALAGVPVHLVTANPYLAARDAAQLAPLYRALGLTVAAVAPGDDDARRRAAWACDVAYTAPRELIFDYLRDRRREPGTAPLLRGLCMALVDEADSVLIDEARTPFVLAREQRDPVAARRWRAALAAARRLHRGVHFDIEPAARRCRLLGDGLRACPAAAGPERDPLWRHDHHRQELVETALAALHVWRRDVDYLLAPPPADAPAGTAPSVEILDPVTGRVSPGRRWAAGLHQLIELKEGLAPSPLQQTIAQLSFQRFFPRYWRLAGTSGTLTEARRELLAVYGLAVEPVPLRLPSRRRRTGDYVFADDRTRWPMVARAVAAHHAAGRAVLVGCDTLADADRLSRLLDGQGLAHQRLDARQDAQEAARVAAAGAPGAITVATRIAGRGTDIRLGDGVAARGGLVVIDAQANGSRRVDRQLHGRCARGGEPGQVLRLQALDAGVFGRELAAPLRRGLALWARHRRGGHLPQVLAWLLRAALQARVQARERGERRLLLMHDQETARGLGFGAAAE